MHTADRRLRDGDALRCLPVAQHAARRGAPDQEKHPPLSRRAAQAQPGGTGTADRPRRFHRASVHPPGGAAGHRIEEVPIAAGQGKRQTRALDAATPPSDPFPLPSASGGVSSRSFQELLHAAAGEETRRLLRDEDAFVSPLTRNQRAAGRTTFGRV